MNADGINARRPYDLEERTLHFAGEVFRFVRSLPRSIVNTEVGRQLVRSAGSIGANYIEANESLGSKDFLMHLRISRKEAKETAYWLRLVDTDSNGELVRSRLLQEATELRKILSAVITNVQTS